MRARRGAATTAVLGLLTLCAPAVQADHRPSQGSAGKDAARGGELRPRCPLLRDPTGDVGVFHQVGAGTAPNDPSLDVVHADLTSAPGRLGVVLGVAQLARSIDQFFEVRFVVEDTHFFVAAYLPHRKSLEKPLYRAGYFSDTEGDAGGYAYLGTVPGRADLTRSQVSFDVDTAQLAKREQIRPGTRLSEVEANAYRAFARSEVILPADSTDTATFVFGSRTACRSRA